MSARQHFTLQDELDGYPRTREALKSYTDADLAREYHESLHDCFGSMFGNNARAYFNLLVDELLRRGITELPNIFKPIQVKHFTR